MLTKIPSGLDEIIETYGPLTDANFESKYLTSFDLPYTLFYEGKPVNRTRCHKLAVENFVQAFKNLMDAGLADQFTEYNGIYAHRSIRGHIGHPSLHSWGVAGDFMASKYPLASLKRWPDAIIKCWQDAGFFYGGDFKSRRDPMHVQLATHY